ncbi:3'-kinase [Limnobaculum zhutongyuii]|uniref:3'-kinase n=1 Tax=Limnobaculum zhutongyuii TaxID=2498113 RepID=A0A411WJZ5_9GAMM|nr:aminoglycoside phosphotransferase family protein [Limnobaculum zhutongyuii]QBH96515.1 3'-kinase [Limnobaculum zhutongyuii]TQS90454.1 3'-kinase [Limnobaculum zhutongyuii]
MTFSDGLTKFRDYITLWQLTEDGEPFHTHSSWLQRVYSGNRLAMLKIPLSAEERRGSRLMVWWNGQGAAQVLKQDDNAMLLEYLSGDQSLVEMAIGGQDDRATRIICQVTNRLHAQPIPSDSELVSLPEWFKSLFLAAKHQGGIFSRAESIASRLLSQPQDIRMLHGDIHHGNILDAGERGWLVIDPKGLSGERGFDFANIFCNPRADIATNVQQFARRLEIVSEVANIKRSRLLAWIISWSALSAAWFIEEGENPETPLAVATLALDELGDSDF